MVIMCVPGVECKDSMIAIMAEDVSMVWWS